MACGLPPTILFQGLPAADDDLVLGFAINDLGLHRAWELPASISV